MSELDKYGSDVIAIARFIHEQGSFDAEGLTSRGTLGNLTPAIEEIVEVLKILEAKS